MKKIIKLFKLLFRLAFLITIVLVGIMIYYAFTIDSKQINFEKNTGSFTDKEAISRLSEAIQIPTVSAGAIDSLAFFELDTLIQNKYPFVDSLLEREKVNHFSTIYKWAGKNPRLEPILLLAHIDVVPVEKAAEDRWTVPPFSGKIQNGYLWGRGALDDKLNVFGILEAAESLLKEGYEPERPIYFAFGHDEETSGVNGAVAMAKVFKERGIKFEYILDEGSIILEDALAGLSQPLAMIGVTEKGYTTLTITANLKDGGHSSMPPPETAVGVLSKAIVTLQENPFPLKIDGATAQFMNYIAPEMDFFHKTLFANIWLTEGLIASQMAADNTSAAMLRTTTAPTMLRGGIKDNILPTRASAKVNFRILPGETVESVADYVRKMINDKRVIVSVDNPEFSSNPTPISPTESFGFQIIQKTIGETFSNTVIAPSLVIAATDARHYTEVSSNIYRFTPLQVKRSDLKTIHGIDEKISTEGYLKMVTFFKQLMKNSCK